MTLFSYLLTFLLLISTARAQDVVQTPPLYSPFIGTTSLNIMHPKFPCKANLEMLKASPKPAIQALWGTFGYEEACLQRSVQLLSGRSHLVSFAFSNEACRRNKRCRQGELFPSDSVGRYERRIRRMDRRTEAEIVRRVSDIHAAVEKLVTPNGRFVLTLGLEDNLTCTAAKKLHDKIKPHWPYEIIRNPLRYHKCKGWNIPLELHTELPGEFFEFANSLDGLDYSNAEIREWFEVAKIFEVQAIFFWRPRWQGITAKFINPRDRTFSIPVSDVRFIRSLMTSRPPFRP